MDLGTYFSTSFLWSLVVSSSMYGSRLPALHRHGHSTSGALLDDAHSQSTSANPGIDVDKALKVACDWCSLASLDGEAVSCLFF